jgi:hypothetical protein
MYGLLPYYQHKMKPIIASVIYVCACHKHSLLQYSRRDINRVLPPKSALFRTGVSQQPGNILLQRFLSMGTAITYKIIGYFYWTFF